MLATSKSAFGPLAARHPPAAKAKAVRASIGLAKCVSAGPRRSTCVMSIGDALPTGPRPLAWGLSASRFAGAAAKTNKVESETGGGNGGGGAPRGGGGGGPGGSGDGDKGKEDGMAGLDIVKGLKARAAYDKEFYYKLLVEQVIGVGASVAGDMAGRPNFGLNELDFVFATLIVGSLTNFSLVYMLAPTAASALVTGGVLARWGSPQGHMFERGAYSILQRLGNPLFKGWQFGLVGLGAGITGTLASNGLLALRKRFDPNFKLQNEMPKWYMNGVAWGLHLTVSSNIRYQMLNGADMVLSQMMPSPIFKAYTAVIRGVNNMIGGTSFVMLAKLIGAQSAAKAPVANIPVSSKKLVRR